MSGATFYQVLGIGPSASADEIKAAYRELVKRYHPDLFHSPEAKTKATEKLRQINEAYAVLGNAERRRRYDEEFVRKPEPQAARRRERRRASAPRRPAQPKRRSVKIPKLRLRFSKKWAGYAVAASALIAVVVYGSEQVPRLAMAWVLLEKLEVSVMNTPARGGDGTGWVRIGEYGSVADCAGAIKLKVQKDEQEGAEAVYDERHATMAITLYIKKEPAATPGSAASFTRRVRSLECRAAQRVEMESRFRRTLRKLGV